MRIAFSLPDDLFHDAERLARRLNKPRGWTYREALREFVARRDPVQAAAMVDRALEQVSTDRDGFLARAARRALRRVER